LPRLSTVCCNSGAAVRSWWAALSSTGLSNRNCSTFDLGSKIWQFLQENHRQKNDGKHVRKTWKFVEIRKIFLEEPGKFGELYGNVLDFSVGNLGIQVILIFYG
jgi:hypothetical protein